MIENHKKRCLGGKLLLGAKFRQFKTSPDTYELRWASEFFTNFIRENDYDWYEAQNSLLPRKSSVTYEAPLWNKQLEAPGFNQSRKFG